MEIDDIIDAELLALSDCSSDHEDDDSDLNDKQIALLSNSEDVDYLQLFLQNSNLQIKKTDQVLCAAEEILNKEDCDSFYNTVIGKYVNENSVESPTHELVERNDKNFQFDIEGLEARLQNLTSSFVEQELKSEKRTVEFENVSKKEEDLTLQDLEKQRKMVEKNLELLEKKEQNILLKLEKEKLFYEQEKINNAACCIQRYHRGYIVRKQYGLILGKKFKEMKRKRFEKRIEILENFKQRQKESEKNESKKFATEIGKKTFENSDNIPKDYKVDEDIQIVNENQNLKNIESLSSDSQSFTTETNSNQQDSKNNLFLSNIDSDKDLDKLDQTKTSLGKPNQTENTTTNVCNNSTDLITNGHPNKLFQNLKEDNKSTDYHLKPELKILPEISDLQSRNELGCLDNIFKENDSSNEISFPEGLQIKTNPVDLSIKNSAGSSTHHPFSNPILKENHSQSDLTEGEICKPQLENTITEPYTVDDDLKRNTAQETSENLNLKSTDNAELKMSQLKKEATDNCNLNQNQKICAENKIENDEIFKSSQYESTESSATTDNIGHEDIIIEDTKNVVVDVDDAKTKHADLKTKICPTKENNSTGDNTDVPFNFFLKNPTAHEITKKDKTNLTYMDKLEPNKSSNLVEVQLDDDFHPKTDNIFMPDRNNGEDNLDLSGVTESEKSSNVCNEINLTNIPINVQPTNNDEKEFLNNSDPRNTNFPTDENISNDAKDITLSLNENDIPVQCESLPQESTAAENKMSTEIYADKNIISSNKIKIQPPALKKQSIDTNFQKDDPFLLLENSAEMSTLNIEKNSINSCDLRDKSIENQTDTAQDYQPLVKGTTENCDLKNDLEKMPIKSENQSYKNSETNLLNWRSECLIWKVKETNISTTGLLKRGIRKSSAAKRLQPITEEQIIAGKWPLQKETGNRKISSLSRIYICNLNNKGSNLLLVQQCSHLTHLTLLKCGLVSLEGLQTCPSLRHINVSSNNISVISCDGMKRLQSLVASDNNLTSIHGVSGCHSLVYLDLSYNYITRVSGLEDANNLLQLRLNNNQLFDISGLENINSLLILDISNNHLTSLNGIQHCGLLRSILASGNNINSISEVEFKNLILLMSLDFSKNNMAQFLSNYIWLPCLETVNLQCNKITLEETELNLSQSFPNLTQLNLSQNLITKTEPILSCLKSSEGDCIKVNLWENLLSNDQETDLMDFSSQQNFFFEFTENEVLRPKNIDLVLNSILGPSISNKHENISPTNISEFCKVVTHSLKEFNTMLQLEKREIKSMNGWSLHSTTDGPNSFNYLNIPPDLVSYHCETLEKQFQLSVKLRKWFESSSYVYFSDKKPALLETKVNQMEYNMDTKETEDFAKKTNQVKLKQNLKTKATPIFAGKLKAQAKEPIEIPFKSNLEIKQSYNKKHRNYAATIIQAYYRGYVCKKQYRVILQTRHNSATLIQAIWKGFLARKSIKKALSSYKKVENNDKTPCDNNNNDEYDFDEVDLSEFNFNEEDFEQQWAYKTDVARQLMMSSCSNKNQNSANIEEDSFQKFETFVKTPLPPITPSSTRSASYNLSHTITPPVSDFTLYQNQESHRSKHSIKEERLTNEWGLKNSNTAELMLKRARKMKGRHKREVNAEVKLKRFQEMSQKVTSQPLMTQQRKTQPSHKMEYFKAREMNYEVKDKQPSEDDERRRQYTYEWLHTSANCAPQNPTEQFGSQNRLLKKRGRSQDSLSIKSGFLPHIPKQRSLVQSPANNMEVVSLSSYGSKRNRELLKDIVKRHGDNDEM